MYEPTVITALIQRWIWLKWHKYRISRHEAIYFLDLAFREELGPIRQQMGWGQMGGLGFFSFRRNMLYKILYDCTIQSYSPTSSSIVLPSYLGTYTSWYFAIMTEYNSQQHNTYLVLNNIFVLSYISDYETNLKAQNWFQMKRYTHTPTYTNRPTSKTLT